MHKFMGTNREFVLHYLTTYKLSKGYLIPKFDYVPNT